MPVVLVRCLRFTGIVEERQIRISMDGRGRWLDNVFIERLWRSLKYEVSTCTHLRPDQNFEWGSRNGSPIITGNVPIRPWLDERLMRRIMARRRHLVRG